MEWSYEFKNFLGEFQNIGQKSTFPDLFFSDKGNNKSEKANTFSRNNRGKDKPKLRFALTLRQDFPKEHHPTTKQKKEDNA